MEEMVEEINSDFLTDCHCHLLPSLDDGPVTNNETLNIARTLSKLGFNKIYCTPHLLKGVYDNTPARVVNSLKSIQIELNSQEIDIELREGIEYTMDEYLAEFLLNPVTLKDNVILCETPSQLNPDFLLDCIYQINRRGLRPLLAHPERSAVIANNKRIMKKLIEMGCLFQGNIGSFAGKHGMEIRKTAVQFLKSGFYSRIGSDAHKHDGLESAFIRGVEVIEQTVGKSATQALFRDL